MSHLQAIEAGIESSGFAVAQTMSMAGGSATSSGDTTPLVKKKRGRPPNANSLSNKITTTLNINVNTSPMCNNSPTAENNSNLIVKQGAPDIFTPLMRVSPTSKRKRSRSAMSLESPSKRAKASLLATPLSAAMGGPSFSPYHHINTQTLDNISMITQSQGGDAMAEVYNTPPYAVMRAQGHPHAPANDVLATPGVQGHSRQVFPTPSHTGGARQLASTEYVLADGEARFEAEAKRSNDARNLLPPVSITREPESAKTAENNKNDFLLKLMIDELGKAVLSSDLFLVDYKPTPKAQERPLPKLPTEQIIEQKFAENPIRDDDLARLDSIIGLEGKDALPYTTGNRYNKYNTATNTSMKPHPGPLRRHHSDVTGAMSSNILSSVSTLSSINESADDLLSERASLQAPQTPKRRDSFSSVSNALTPSNFNLTPSFNSMMYSIMNINSPQQKKPTNGSQFLLNQEFFMNGTPSQPPSLLHLAQNTISMTNLMTGAPRPQVLHDTAAPQTVLSSSASSNTDDSGDARVALKKIIQVKRK